MTIGGFNPRKYSAYDFYNSGDVVKDFTVQPIFWGEAWDQPQTPSPQQILDAISKIVRGPYVKGLAQYGIGRGSVTRHAMFDTRTSLGVDFEDRTPLDDQVLSWQRDNFGGVRNAIVSPFGEMSIEPASDSHTSILAIFTPPNVLPKARPYGGYNKALDTSVLFIPGVVHYMWVGNTGDLDSSIAPVFAHELVELLSDPDYSAGIRRPGVRDGTTYDKAHPTIPDPQIADNFGFNAVDRVGGIRAAAYWLQDIRRPGVPGGARRGGNFVQSAYGHVGNFEAMVVDGGRFHHLWRNNDAAGLPWSSAGEPPLIDGLKAKSAALLELAPLDGNPPGELCAVVAVEDSSNRRSLAVTQTNHGTWSPVSGVFDEQAVRVGVTGELDAIRSRYSAGDSDHDNPLMVALPDGYDIVLYRLNPSNLTTACSPLRLTPPTPPISVELLQANLGPFDLAPGQPGANDDANAGNLELLVRCRPLDGGPEELWHTSIACHQTNAPDAFTGTWTRVADAGTPAVVTGRPALFQSTYGKLGNFELLVPKGSTVDHWACVNDTPGRPWRHIRSFTMDDGAAVAWISAFQGSYIGSGAFHHNFEALLGVHTSDGSFELSTSWFDFESQWRAPVTLGVAV
ncbi:MAG: hypothetical protein ACYDHH_30030 [Solirubrobacteraceae bacterium]